MQRSGEMGRATTFICVTLSLLAALGISLRFLPVLRAGDLLNPDSYMRLVRLRDTLDSGIALYSVARDGSGHGTLLHWSHLIESLLCVLMVPFSVVLDRDAALHAAALIFGPLCIAALGVAVAWVAAPFAERKWLWFGAILPALSPGIASYGVAGVVHHHVGVVIVAIMCWGWAARLIATRPPPASGLSLGAWAALGIWLTPESVPLTIMAFGALLLAWVVSPDRDDIGRETFLSGLSFAVVTVLALLVDPPAAGIAAAEPDRLSILFAGLAMVVAATGAGAWAMQRSVTRWRSRLAAGGAIGLACGALWVALFWGAIFPPHIAEGEARFDAMFGDISEMRSVAGAAHILNMLLTGMLALLLVVVMAVRRRSLLLSYVAVCLAGLEVLGWWHGRFAAYPEVAGAIAFPLAITRAGGFTVNWPPIGQSFARLAVVLLFVQGPYLGEVFNIIGKKQSAAVADASSCKIDAAIPMLAPHGDAIVLANVNDTPEILYKTRLRTVGSLYHRNIDAFLRLRAAWRSRPSEAVPLEIDAAEVSLVLGCESPERSVLVEDLGGPTLSDQLRTGKPPPWLRRLAEDPGSGQTLYEVHRSGEAAKSAALLETR